MGDVHIGFVLDMSGSMAAIEKATREGAVEWLRKQKKETPNALLSVTVFDTIFERWLEGVPIKDVKVATTLSEWKPRGGTALYDALGSTIDRMKADVKKGDKAIVVVMTDGEENSSTKWDRKRVNTIINAMTKRGNWTFIYLGANVDAWAEASALGIPRGSTMSYSATAGSTMRATGGLASSVSKLATANYASTQTVFGDAGVEQDVRDEDDK